MKTSSIDDFSASIVTADKPAADPLLLVGAVGEVSQFNLFNMADLMRTYRSRPPMTFDRRPFYKISLLRGRSRVEYTDRVVEIDQSSLFFATPREPYRWVPYDLAQTGYFCVFTDEFLLPAKSGIVLDDLPIFQPGSYPVWSITDAQYEAIEAIFQKMALEITSDYTFKYSLLRTYLLELIHAGQKLQPGPTQALPHTASTRVTAQFTELLERQFPLGTPRQQLRLRTAKDYADQLAVHVNHLNRVLKETTGHTTTALIGSRVAQEARILLKQTNWTVSEIAESLGFANVAHFCSFFKRQTTLTPGSFRE
ncbi:helix-turn-helix domain-containing protein [Fibrella aquatilis]|uniref:Helix-turn-helix transcriptional regulator n=1 Tax=Fibrella aquatilis TaxID=2817059 RepID=A0A939JUQ3_9BACT|nr:helix-turn-helix transcriptional regulator [Fibrella aquatilis]MBO0930022.1 helix-turn-helix transcriptional regulator [Fibrella aquatilis]